MVARYRPWSHRSRTRGNGERSWNRNGPFPNVEFVRVNLFGIVNFRRCSHHRCLASRDEHCPVRAVTHTIVPVCAPRKKLAFHAMPSVMVARSREDGLARGSRTFRLALFDAAISCCDLLCHFSISALNRWPTVALLPSFSRRIRMR